MEKSKVVIDGGIKLPIGYRFHPTDEEVIVHYLKRKVFGLPLPASVIPVFDVFHTGHPCNLPGEVKEKRYFFHKQTRNLNLGSKCTRRPSTGCGYWKSTGKDKKIVNSHNQTLVGIRKTLIYCERKPSNPEIIMKTRWVMHQYCCLVGNEIIPNSTSQMANMSRKEDWFVYSVFQKKIRQTKKKQAGLKSQVPFNCKKENERSTEVIKRPSFEGCDLRVSEPALSSCSSGITEVSCIGLEEDQDDGEEEEIMSARQRFNY